MPTFLPSQKLENFDMSCKMGLIGPVDRPNLRALLCWGGESSSESKSCMYYQFVTWSKLPLSLGGPPRRGTTKIYRYTLFVVYSGKTRPDSKTFHHHDDNWGLEKRRACSQSSYLLGITTLSSFKSMTFCKEHQLSGNQKSLQTRGPRS